MEGISLEDEKAGFCGVAIFEEYGHPSDISTTASFLSLFNLNRG